MASLSPHIILAEMNGAKTKESPISAKRMWGKEKDEGNKDAIVYGSSFLSPLFISASRPLKGARRYSKVGEKRSLKECLLSCLGFIIIWQIKEKEMPNNAQTHKTKN